MCDPPAMTSLSGPHDFDFRKYHGILEYQEQKRTAWGDDHGAVSHACRDLR